MSNSLDERPPRSLSFINKVVQPLSGKGDSRFISRRRQQSHITKILTFLHRIQTPRKNRRSVLSLFYIRLRPFPGIALCAADVGDLFVFSILGGRRFFLPWSPHAAAAESDRCSVFVCSMPIWIFKAVFVVLAASHTHTHTHGADREESEYKFYGQKGKWLNVERAAGRAIKVDL